MSTFGIALSVVGLLLLTPVLILAAYLMVAGVYTVAGIVTYWFEHRNEGPNYPGIRAVRIKCRKCGDRVTLAMHGQMVKRWKHVSLCPQCYMAEGRYEPVSALVE